MRLPGDPLPRGFVVTYEGDHMTERELTIALQSFDRGMQGDVQFRRTVMEQLRAVPASPPPLLTGPDKDPSPVLDHRDSLLGNGR